MIACTAIASMAAFGASLWWCGVGHVARDVLRTASEAAAIMRAPGLDDRQREAVAQRTAIRLFASVGSMLVRLCVAIVASLLPIGIAGAVGLASPARVLLFMTGWPAALAATAIGGVLYGALGSRWRTS